MKKILYVTTVSCTIRAFLISHINELIKEKNEVEVACNIDVDISKELSGIKLNKISFSRNPLSLSNLKAIKQIQKLFDLKKYDIVHVHTPIAAFITRFALRNKKVEIIYTAHGFHFFKGASIINWMTYYPLERIAARWTDKLITINSEDFNRAQNFNIRDKKNIYKINGVGIKAEDYKIINFIRGSYRSKLGLNESDFIILILAEINKNKNHMQIIKALKELKIHDNIKVLCAGEGPVKERLINIVDKKGLANNIKFIGHRTDVKELINEADCVCLFSKREGLGKCLLEGMTAGKAIIATKTRGPKELVIDGVNGYLVNINDYKGTAQAIEVLYKNKKLREYMGGESLKLVEKYYLDNVLQTLDEIYM